MESIYAVGWETGDQIHVHSKAADFTHRLKRIQNIRRGMPATDGFQNGIRHALRVDADPVHTVPAHDEKLFFGDGVGPAGFDCPFPQGRKIIFSLQPAEELIQLRSAERGGRAAAHIDGNHPQPERPDLLCHGGELLMQRFQKRRDQLHALFGGLADKAAVGAAGRAEGNADIQADIFRLEKRIGPQGTARCIQTEERPLVRNIIVPLKPAQCLRFL